MENLFGQIWIQNVGEILSFKPVENVVTLEGLPFIFGSSKKWMHTLQNDVHMLSFLDFVMGSHMRQHHKPH